MSDESRKLNRLQMGKDDYPCEKDVWDWILSSNLKLAPGVTQEQLHLDDKINGEIELWENTVGWFPFLNVQGDEKIFLDQTGRGWGWDIGWGAFGGFGTWRSDGIIMDFECGILNLSSIKIHETILKPGHDFHLMPLNAPRMGWPFTYMKFTASWAAFGLTGKEIEITAKCGYCHKLPYRVWNAIIGKTIAEIAPQLELNLTSGTSGWQAGPARESFAVGSQSITGLSRTWMRNYYETHAYYLRHTI